MKTLLIILTAGLCLLTSRASAQVLLPNALDFTNTGSTTLVATVGTVTNANLGPGWNASNSFVGVLSSQTLTIDGGNANDGGGLFRVGQSGLTGVAGSFSATKIFAGIKLADFTTYNLTIAGNASATVSLLGSMNIDLRLGGSSVYLAPSGSVLGLLDQPGTESTVFSFTTGDINNTSDLEIAISGSTLVAALGASASLTKINLSAFPVPEPGSLMLLLAGTLLVVRRRRPALP